MLDKAKVEESGSKLISLINQPHRTDASGRACTGLAAPVLPASGYLHFDDIVFPITSGTPSVLLVVFSPSGATLIGNSGIEDD